MRRLCADGLRVRRASAKRGGRGDCRIIAHLRSFYQRVSDRAEALEAAGRFLEGTGALVLDRVHRVAYVALSERADEQTAREWCQEFGYELELFETHDDKNIEIYHTNVLMAVGTHVAVICPNAFRDPARYRAVRQRLESTGRDVVEITLAQLKAFCGNVLEVRGGANGDQLLLAMSASARDALSEEQCARLERGCPGGLLVCSIPTIQDIGGGSVRCMMAELY